MKNIGPLAAAVVIGLLTALVLVCDVGTNPPQEPIVLGEMGVDSPSPIPPAEPVPTLSPVAETPTQMPTRAPHQ